MTAWWLRRVSRGTGTLMAGLLAGVLWLPVHLTDTQPATRVWRIGLFHVGLDHVPPSLEPLRATLKALGYEDRKGARAVTGTPATARSGSTSATGPYDRSGDRSGKRFAFLDDIRGEHLGGGGADVPSIVNAAGWDQENIARLER